MTDQGVRIINCGPVFFFTTYLPPSRVTDLFKDTSPDVSVSLIVSKDPEYLGLVVTWLPVNPPSQPGADTDAIRAAVQYVWSELHRRGVVDSAVMPDWIEGNPLDMLPQPVRVADASGVFRSGS